jgi:hypothetical protein
VVLGLCVCADKDVSPVDGALGTEYHATGK